MANPIDFTDRVAIITGAGGGLGRAYALALAERGAKVVVNDLGGDVRGNDGTTGPSSPAQRVVDEIVATGGEAMVDGNDITDEAAVDALVSSVIDKWGRIDILMNNAGILRDKSFAKMDNDDFRRVLEVHLMGSVNCTKAVWPHMAEAGYGRILMTTSSSGIYGNFGQANYAAAKSGLVGLMNVLAIEGAKKNIKVNSIAPTAATRMTEDLLPQRVLDIMGPETIAPGALFMVSEDAPTKTILGAGAGVFAVSQMVESRGVYLPDNARTPEVVAERWNEIADVTDANPLESAFEQTSKYAALAARELGLHLES
ncbi:SDR family NAD(P)-dependent oxidoreductase [Dietzia psychralcaliphila]|uniref:3-oxoacyl-ACP reductase n=1 Tax=Dietzia psychralcaliphila TaxID=139021 RepID=A0AAD0JQS9_9ACTN|nr:SDR family NAD(P)-dependent oxidoreductase [Dietzia psychralcaliphila]AWH94185.1 3-oxoacyl-ACP reductase [Dietzia psychralcaliphila]PTM89766.1 NAD(P)-dependent dehydrogenase (short-subunit alcohol dehydrogenase family) [Dietzia psychralcaliphila]